MPKSKKRVSPPLVDMSYLDLNNLDLDRAYSLQEFEYISEQLKTRPIKVKEEFVYHFERDKAGKLVPMAPTIIYKEAVVAEIARQLGNWNVWTKQGGVVTTSQGGFKFGSGSGEIRIPDVAFTSKEICHRLSNRQIWTFQGEAFSPTVVVEVDDFDNIQGSKFREMDSKFKDIYFARGTSVKIGLLIDPKNHHIWLYRRNAGTNVVRRRKSQWQNLVLNDILPGFTLLVDQLEIEPLVNPVTSSSPMSTESTQSSEKEAGRLQFRCPYPSCEETFESIYLTIEHAAHH
ncbi:5085_t:CDS:2 [Paraglomus occultum]|uniref:5085_t:CDS:1 n=1 Tax=Paraglomus occultum TaxID=144539 RepID=A0A9N9FAS8_9GLOM|nr:5085_t:CDS:2 [Paraglomus occultum]